MRSRNLSISMEARKRFDTRINEELQNSYYENYKSKRER
jgi:hypothetical protein